MQISVEDYAWLMDPDNKSGFPALYECVIPSCKRVFRWFEVDGESGSYCDECSKIIHQRRHARLLARNNKFESYVLAPYEKPVVPAVLRHHEI